ncbi:hypothetical protein [Pseudoalteromonas luteoviolacea]|uniref:Uncharacterized protein n=1 Tax=Pseudoalteromonas luteoviolacea H33 TaxID=1365251 RepID=A0A167E4U3_9GAMM|nr:hypothetical protein [Pseudoalteromonas luteoviolacea]KZN50044.1 hypothetical protein N476_16995 [Pseudoalteromonas luteoviolacea H33]KZN76382.1 hypothetical protein N477_16890 [Pseudoalteromonas luteoviolacea H33-S]
MKLKIQKKSLKALSNDKGLENGVTPQVAGAHFTQAYGCQQTVRCATNNSKCCHASDDASCRIGWSCLC